MRLTTNQRASERGLSRKSIDGGCGGLPVDSGFRDFSKRIPPYFPVFVPTMLLLTRCYARFYILFRAIHLSVVFFPISSEGCFLGKKEGDEK